jgi:hypothetical protein
VGIYNHARQFLPPELQITLSTAISRQIKAMSIPHALLIDIQLVKIFPRYYSGIVKNTNTFLKSILEVRLTSLPLQVQEHKLGLMLVLLKFIQV